MALNKVKSHNKNDGGFYTTTLERCRLNLNQSTQRQHSTAQHTPRADLKKMFECACRQQCPAQTSATLQQAKTHKHSRRSLISRSAISLMHEQQENLTLPPPKKHPNPHSSISHSQYCDDSLWHIVSYHIASHPSNCATCKMRTRATGNKSKTRCCRQKSMSMIMPRASYHKPINHTSCHPAKTALLYNPTVQELWNVDHKNWCLSQCAAWLVSIPNAMALQTQSTSQASRQET